MLFQFKLIKYLRKVLYENDVLMGVNFLEVGKSN